MDYGTWVELIASIVVVLVYLWIQVSISSKNQPARKLELSQDTFWGGNK